MKKETVLRVEGITRRYPGVTALDSVSLEVRAGEVLAIIGENGAGKSTLMKILAGIEQPDNGQIFLGDKPIEFTTPDEALKKRIVLIHQELSLVDTLDISANIFMGRELRRRGFLLKEHMHRRSARHLKRVGLDRKPTILLKQLSPGEQQQVEIARALSHRAKIIIFDEPTSSLSFKEAENLLSIIRELKEQGVAVIYISHRLNEVQSIADRVVGLRDGERVGELDASEINRDSMVRLMVGRELDSYFPERTSTAGNELFRVNSLTTNHHPAPLSLTVHAGEIVGIAGLVGSGRTELLEALFGIRSSAEGSVTVAGKQITHSTPAHAIRSGIALAPEDRKSAGVILHESVADNLTLPAITQQRLRIFRNQKSERSIASDLVSRLNVKAASPEQLVNNLSGGNQQKVLFGKWLPLNPHLFLLDEPTRGVDVGAKREIYEIMNALAEEGSGVLFVSSDMEEILGMADRVYVMADRRIAGELSGPDRTEENIMQLAIHQEDALCA